MYLETSEENTNKLQTPTTLFRSGKTDGFIFMDNGSKQVLDLWHEGKEEEARNILDEYVLRITTEVSINS